MKTWPNEAVNSTARDIVPLQCAQQALAAVGGVLCFGPTHALFKPAPPSLRPNASMHGATCRCLGPSVGSTGSANFPVDLQKSSIWLRLDAFACAPPRRSSAKNANASFEMHRLTLLVASARTIGQPIGGGSSKSTSSWCSRPLSLALAVSTIVLCPRMQASVARRLSGPTGEECQKGDTTVE